MIGCQMIFQMFFTRNILIFALIPLICHAASPLRGDHAWTPRDKLSYLAREGYCRQLETFLVDTFYADNLSEELIESTISVDDLTLTLSEMFSYPEAMLLRECIIILVRYGADLNTGGTRIPLNYALDEDDLDLMQYLLKSGAGVEVLRRDAVVDKAIINGKWAMADLLMRYHASYGALGDVLLDMVKYYQLDGVRICLKHNPRKESLRLALDAAIENGFEEAVVELRERNYFFATDDMPSSPEVRRDSWKSFKASLSDERRR